MEQRTCRGCGASFAANRRGRPRVWCSDACRIAGSRKIPPLKPQPQTGRCYGCGVDLVTPSGRQRYCSAACRRDTQLRTLRERYQPVGDRVIACGECGAELVAKARQEFCVSCAEVRKKRRDAEREKTRSKGPERSRSKSKPWVVCAICGVACPDKKGVSSRRFCSVACTVAARAAPRSKIKIVDCPSCGCLFVRSGAKGNGARRTCSDGCSAAMMRSKQREWSRAHRVPPSARDGACSPLAYGNCRRCGTLFVHDERCVQVYCGRKCAKAVERKRYRHARRTSGRSETFSLLEIAERDGWRCHLCGKQVPDREYKARDLDPTIDHLVPVSAGGSHTRDNVALAHNRCNWQRGADGLAQLRLVG